jgi:hypothetical protein
MSDRPDFLPAREFVPLPAEPGGFDAALSSARRRRRRQVGEAGIAVVMGVALLAGIQLGPDVRPDGADQVRVDDDRPDGDVAPAPDPSPTELALPLATGSAAPSGQGSTVDRPASDGTGERPVAAPTASPRPGRRPPTSSQERLPARWAASRSGPFLNTSCVNGSWCVYVRAQARPDSDAYRYDFVLTVCRAATAGRATLSWPTTQPIDLTVRRGERTYWTWSRYQSFPAEDEVLTVDPRECYDWTTPYLNTDDDGALLSEGQYTLRGWSVAEELGEGRYNDTTFTVD